MIFIPFTIERGENGRPHVLVNGVAQSGYATEREALLWEAYREMSSVRMEGISLLSKKDIRIGFLESELGRMQQMLVELSERYAKLEADLQRQGVAFATAAQQAAALDAQAANQLAILRDVAAAYDGTGDIHDAAEDAFNYVENLP